MQWCDFKIVPGQNVIQGFLHPVGYFCPQRLILTTLNFRFNLPCPTLCVSFV